MPRYRRAVVPAGTFFFTVVTYKSGVGSQESGDEALLIPEP